MYRSEIINNVYIYIYNTICIHSIIYTNLSLFRAGPGRATGTGC